MSCYQQNTHYIWVKLTELIIKILNPHSHAARAGPSLCSLQSLPNNDVTNLKLYRIINQSLIRQSVIFSLISNHWPSLFHSQIKFNNNLLISHTQAISNEQDFHLRQSFRKSAPLKAFKTLIWIFTTTPDNQTELHGTSIETHYRHTHKLLFHTLNKNTQIIKSEFWKTHLDVHSII